MGEAKLRRTDFCVCFYFGVCLCCSVRNCAYIRVSLLAQQRNRSIAVRHACTQRRPFEGDGAEWRPLIGRAPPVLPYINGPGALRKQSSFGTRS